jgi:hypothetical protein
MLAQRMRHADGAYQERLTLRRQLERASQQGDRVPVRSRPSSAFERADGLNAEFRAFGEFLLRYPGI